MKCVFITISFLLIFCSLSIVSGGIISGFILKDDLLPRQPEVSDQLPSYMVRSAYPTELSICAWVYPEFWRFPKLGFLEVRVPETLNKTYPNIQLLIRKGIFEISDTDYFLFDALGKNILRKWNGVCVSVDHTNNIGSAAHNGIVVSARKASTAPNMGGRYGGKILSNSDKFKVMIGRYAFDKGNFIGKLGGINVWNRTLSKGEMKKYTDCKSPTKASGNLISDQTVFDFNNSRIEQLNITLKELACSNQNDIENIFIPKIVTDQQEAFDTCKKIGSDTIGGEFSEEADFAKYYNSLHSNKVYKRNCWIGGRLRTFLPYKENTDGTKLVHIVKNTTLGVDYWAPISDIISSKPRKVENPGCMVGYFGIYPYKENLVVGFDNYYFGDICTWSSCFSCELHNSFEKTSTVKLRGLCKDTYFDDEYLISTGPGGYIRYVGTKSTTIDYEEENRRWKMSIVTRPEIVAYSNSSARSLLVGNSEWMIRCAMKTLKCNTVEFVQKVVAGQSKNT